VSFVLASGTTVSTGADLAGNPNMLRCRGFRVTIRGTFHNDVMFGTKFSDVIRAYRGDDVIFSGKGNDIICGNHGNDIIHGNGGGQDNGYGGRGFDRCIDIKLVVSCISLGKG
jgi:Ca2+-binding RTX toxin-like protein